jgi:hypothetical protein
VPRTPSLSHEAIYPGTWYLTSVDDSYRRKYTRKPVSGAAFDLEKATDELVCGLFSSKNHKRTTLTALFVFSFKGSFAETN